jgi:predicted transcriptional regulator
MIKNTKSGLLQLLVAITITLTIAITIAITTPAAGYNGDYGPYASVNDTYFKELNLNIYVDETGKALVMGYVEREDIDSNTLPFLELSEYIYDNDTNQLYAFTNALTCKYGGRWSINFTTDAYACYTEYHTIFYLPCGVMLGKISCSQGLAHSTAISNDSFIVDVQGCNVESPVTIIEYQQPLDETGGEGIDSGSGFRFGYLSLAIALAALTLALIIAIAIARMKKGGESPRHEGGTTAVKRVVIETTADMLRVMETLTDRERAIINALLKHNGEMTQTDLRYETEIPKSSLTGIIRSLERRKIIIKKERGRMNVIELSDWFLSKGERK